MFNTIFQSYIFIKEHYIFEVQECKLSHSAMVKLAYLHAVCSGVCEPDRGTIVQLNSDPYHR